MDNNKKTAQKTSHKTDTDATLERPLGSKFGIVEWAAIIGTGVTMLTTLVTFAYTAGSYGNRIQNIEIATKDIPVTIQSIKSDLQNLQGLREDVKALNKLESRISVLEAKP